MLLSFTVSAMPIVTKISLLFIYLCIHLFFPSNIILDFICLPNGLRVPKPKIILPQTLRRQSNTFLSDVTQNRSLCLLHKTFISDVKSLTYRLINHWSVKECEHFRSVNQNFPSVNCISVDISAAKHIHTKSIN